MDYELPDGTRLSLEDGATGADAAAAIGAGLARAALAIKVDGELRDLSRPLPSGEGNGAHAPRLEILTDRRGEEALALVRADAAHVLAAAMLELYPGMKISIGPAIDNGFYYDFDFPDGVTVNDADFPRIEAAMKAHIDADEPFVREELGVQDAIQRFHEEKQPYKVELIEDLIKNEGATTVSLYTNGPFTDLCRGPHAPTTKRIKSFKLQSVAGSYWRGDANRQMLTRVYGTAFFSDKDLQAYLELVERARANDHRRLGPQLGLFGFSELAPGMAFWYPKGTVVFNELVALSREMGKPRGYTEVKTPQLYDSALYKTSGHWEKFQEEMFISESAGAPYGLKPMNCPGHAQLYSMTPHSYRDLPVRYSEPGLLHRNEPSGTLHGLLRTRNFVQDDAHIFCTEEQIQEEVAGCLEFAFATYKVFGVDVRLELSTRPEKRLGSDEQWDRSEGALRSALESHGLQYTVNEGDGAFYGAKIDMHMTDSLGRSWQLGTVQLDYLQPERFGLVYTGADNVEHRPVMIHRALMGSYERFIGISLEHVRAEVDDRAESVGRKIRDGELRKLPYMLVVGDREAEQDEVSVREHRAGDTGAGPGHDFAQRVLQESKSRSMG